MKIKHPNISMNINKNTSTVTHGTGIRNKTYTTYTETICYIIKENYV